MEISLKLDITGLSSSNGWIDRFKKSHNLSYRSMCNKSTSLDQAMVDEWKKNVLPSLIENYTLQNIFNADEKGLFSLFPDKMYTGKGE